MAYSIHQPPEWFQLSAYDTVEDFNEFRWALEIQRRAYDWEVWTELADGLHPATVDHYFKYGPHGGKTILVPPLTSDDNWQEFSPTAAWLEKFYSGRSKKPARVINSVANYEDKTGYEFNGSL